MYAKFVRNEGIKGNTVYQFLFSLGILYPGNIKRR